MKKIFFFIIFYSAIAVHSLLHAFSISDDQIRLQLKEVKAMSELLSPQLITEKNQLNKVLILRDQIYRLSINAEEGMDASTTIEFFNLPEVYKSTLFYRTRAQLCNGRAILLMAALKAHNIPSRMVALFKQVDDAPDIVYSHASVSVYIDNSWIAIDPHFNLAFTDASGKLIDWKDIVDLTKGNKTINRISHGYVNFRNQSVSDYELRYNTTFNSLTNYSMVTASDRSLAQIYNTNWDGIIRYKNGSTFDAKTAYSSGIYEILSRKLD